MLLNLKWNFHTSSYLTGHQHLIFRPSLYPIGKPSSCAWLPGQPHLLDSLKSLITYSKSPLTVLILSLVFLILKYLKARSVVLSSPPSTPTPLMISMLLWFFKYYIWRDDSKIYIQSPEHSSRLYTHTSDSFLTSSLKWPTFVLTWTLHSHQNLPHPQVSHPSQWLLHLSGYLDYKLGVFP